jgi:hypothetical protein
MSHVDFLNCCRSDPIAIQDIYGSEAIVHESSHPLVSEKNLSEESLRTKSFYECDRRV